VRDVPATGQARYWGLQSKLAGRLRGLLNSPGETDADNHDVLNKGKNILDSG